MRVVAAAGLRPGCGACAGEDHMANWGWAGAVGISLALVLAGGAAAQDISFTPEDGPGLLSEAFERVVPGGMHTTEYLHFGVNFTGFRVAAYGGGPAAWSYVDDNDMLSLTEFVSGRIVLPGTTIPATTDSISVEADLAEDAEDVMLMCWGPKGKFLGSSFADDGVGVDGDLVAAFAAPGIASFMLVEHHRHEEFFGVRRIQLNTPVPAPGAAALLACAAVMGQRRRGR
jgi:hypothetical protein